MPMRIWFQSPLGGGVLFTMKTILMGLAEIVSIASRRGGALHTRSEEGHRLLVQFQSPLGGGVLFTAWSDRVRTGDPRFQSPLGGGVLFTHLNQINQCRRPRRFNRLSAGGCSSLYWAVQRSNSQPVSIASRRGGALHNYLIVRGESVEVSIASRRGGALHST